MPSPEIFNGKCECGHDADSHNNGKWRNCLECHCQLFDPSLELINTDWEGLPDCIRNG